MRMRTRSLMGAAALLACMVVPSRAIVGIGVHYGLDFSLSMDAAFDEPIAFQEFGVTQFTGFMRGFNDTIIAHSNSNLDSAELSSLYEKLEAQGSDFSATLPILLSRTGIERTWVNLGGKFYIDIIPVLDAVELSVNMGVWEYEAYLKYPQGVKSNVTEEGIRAAFSDGDYSSVLVMNDSIPITLTEFGMDYAGLSGTPYSKLQFDLSIRKNIVALPKRMKIFRLYAGGGPSMHFATPVVTSEMVEKVAGDAIEKALEEGSGDFSQLQTKFKDGETLKPIIEEILAGLAVPKFGLNILVGTHVKLPVVPIGFYVDGKLMIPFGPYDEAANLTGYGFLLNGGITVGL